MELLPQEIKESILFFCDDDSLALFIPRVSKLYNKLLEDNCAIWKAKCNLIKKNENSKLPDQSWKRFYFIEDLKLFPLYGFTIGKSTYGELRAAPGAVEGLQSSSRYVTYQRQDFWVGTGDIFYMMYTTSGDPLPTEWTDQGLHWNISWGQCKALLKKKVGNYLARKPTKREFCDKQCFSARLFTILKVPLEGDIYYQIQFTFNYKEGDENTAGTLYSMLISSAEKHETDFKDRYIDGKREEDYKE